MKKYVRLASVLGCTLALIAGISETRAQDTAALITIEKADQVNGPWAKVPANQITITTEGQLLDPMSWGPGFYRLLIQTGDAAGAPVGLPPEAVPDSIRQFAQEHLDSIAVEEADWNGAVLGPLVVPIFHPAIGEGKTPAFFEFKVVGRSEQSSSAVDPLPERGYILVSSGPHDPPIAEYATEGPTPSEKLRFLAKSSTAHIMRYSEGYWAAEGPDGKLLASFGSTPYRIPEGILQFTGNDALTEIVDGKEVVPGPRPDLVPMPYDSYDEFKQDVVSGPVHTMLRRLTAQRAQLDWNLRADKPPEIISVPIGQVVTILTGMEILSAEVDDPIATVRLSSTQKGLDVLGEQRGATLLTVVSPDLNLSFYVLDVGQSGGVYQLNGWSSWSTWYGGACADIPRYTQEWSLSGCCSSGWSGCGPTAWAMFYGYWDHRGVVNLIGGSGATPWSNNDDVRNCIRSVFSSCHTWCTGINGAAATNPWDITDGYKWAVARGEGISLTASWTVPYTSSGPRNRARASIRDDNRPAIVGTGYYSHFPLAYGYRHRKYTWLGITWDTDYNWKVNNGWGGTSCVWVSANSCWYGTRGYCY